MTKSSKRPPMLADLDWIDGNLVTPILEGIPTYRAMEQVIAGARDTIHLAYWLIDPDLETVGYAGRWGELLRAAVGRGVTVRLIIADFDPILGHQYHQSAWHGFRRFMAMRSKLAPEDRCRFQIICSRHEARIGSAIRLMAQPVLIKHLQAIVDDLNQLSLSQGRDALNNRLATLPGLWPVLRVRHERKAPVSMGIGFPSVYPAAHHEKLCVVDDRTVFLGGLDIDDDRFDDQQHEGDRAWHDVACKLEGPASSYFARHFRRRWNDELDGFQTFVATLEPPDQVPPIPEQDSIEPIELRIEATAKTSGQARVAPLQTQSRQEKSSFSRSPRSEIATCLEGYLALIRSAEDFIYIENQFLRSGRIIDGLIAQGMSQRKLQIIAVVPVAPDMALTNDDADAATQHGQFLQDEAIRRLQETLPDQFGAFTFKRDGKPVHQPERDTERTLKDIVYVHAKIMIVDDCSALIGSANLNDRSLYSDTETAILWDEPDAIRDLRASLWRHALGEAWQTKQGPITLHWRQIAEANASKPPAQRQGFVMPLAQAERRAFRRRNWLVPEELV